MRYVLTSEEMRSADDATSTQFLIPSAVLMERAALAVACEIDQRFSDKSKICIVCGNGNNGGDGYAIGRILHEKDYQVDIFTANPCGHTSENNRLQKDILARLNIPVSTELPQNEYDIIVDAVFGTGFQKRANQDRYDEVITRMNCMDGFKIAVDIPSGLDSDHGAVYGPCFYADLTVTFAFYKRGHFLHHGKHVCGEIVCKDIGISKQAFLSKLPYSFAYDVSDVKKLLPKRNISGHKGTYKKAGIIAGSKDIGGCAILSSKAALNMGVGYVKVLTHEAHVQTLMTHLPESLVYTYREHSYQDLQDCSAIAIGPGIGTGKEAYELLYNVLSYGKCKLILDADAINLIAASSELKELLKSYTKAQDVIMTPHKKELERLCAKASTDDFACLHETEQKIADEYHVYLVCKDAATRVYMPDCTVYINRSGNDGMATAGSGDVLSGILAGLVSQDIETKTAVSLGVFIHGLCGDYVLKKSNKYSLKAGDLVDALQYVLRGDK